MERALEQLNQARDIDLAPQRLVHLYLREKAKILDKLKRYDEAYGCFVRAAELQRVDKEYGYDPEKSAKATEEQIAFISNELVSRLPVYRETEADRGPVPIFIVGFPRSGTTLVEQILCSHDNIAAGDELTFIDELIDKIPADLQVESRYPQYLALLEKIPNIQSMLERWRDYYLDRAREAGVSNPEVRFFTDKMPLNLLFLPLISMLFPGSPVIHLMRNPMDSVMSSVYSGFARHIFWAHNLEDASEHFVETLSLAKHAVSVMDMRYLMIRYEDLVNDQERWSKKLIEFVGLPWSDKCLEFHNTDRVARTASYHQITQKIYTSSIGRYKNYEKFLDKPLAILRPAMEEFGYLD